MLCAEDNIQVCQPTTPAQYFHLLASPGPPQQAQAPGDRHPQVGSPRPSAGVHPSTTFTDGSLPGAHRRPKVDLTTTAVTRVVLGSGKVAVEAASTARRAGRARAGRPRRAALPLANGRISPRSWPLHPTCTRGGVAAGGAREHGPVERASRAISTTGSAEGEDQCGASAESEAGRRRRAATRSTSRSRTHDPRGRVRSHRLSSTLGGWTSMSGSLACGPQTAREPCGARLRRRLAPVTARACRPPTRAPRGPGPGRRP